MIRILKRLLKRWLLNIFFIPYPFKEIYNKWKDKIDRDTLLIALYAAIVPVEIKEVRIEELFVINETTLPIDDFLRKPDGPSVGIIDRSIFNSPHYKLLEIYKEQGLDYLKNNYKETDYYKMIKYFSQMGRHFSMIAGSFVNKNRKNSDEYIWYRIERLITVYENIKNIGYLGAGHEKKMISVMDKPIYITRFLKDFPWKPYEILFGHHRAAALAANGIKKVLVIVFKDAVQDSNYTIFNQWWGRFKFTRKLCERISGMPVNEASI